MIFFAKIEIDTEGCFLIFCERLIEFNAMPIKEYIVGNTECITYDIVFDCKRFLIGCIYRPPYNDIEYMSNIISTIDTSCIKLPKQNLVLFGDFNLPNVDWSVPKPLTNEKFTNLFLNCVLLNGFEQIVKLSTKGSNIFDLVLCRNLHMLPDAHIMPSFVNNNHETVELKLNYTNYKLN